MIFSRADFIDIIRNPLLTSTKVPHITMKDIMAEQETSGNGQNYHLHSMTLIGSEVS